MAKFFERKNGKTVEFDARRVNTHRCEDRTIEVEVPFYEGNKLQYSVLQLNIAEASRLVSDLSQHVAAHFDGVNL